jgi:hypothetical protein
MAVDGGRWVMDIVDVMPISTRVLGVDGDVASYRCCHFCFERDPASAPEATRIIIYDRDWWHRLLGYPSSDLCCEPCAALRARTTTPGEG